MAKQEPEEDVVEVTNLSQAMVDMAHELLDTSIEVNGQELTQLISVPFAATIADHMLNGKLDD